MRRLGFRLPSEIYLVKKEKNFEAQKAVYFV